MVICFGCVILADLSLDCDCDLCRIATFVGLRPLSDCGLLDYRALIKLFTDDSHYKFVVLILTMLKICLRPVFRFSKFKLDDYTYEDYATMCGLIR